MTVEIPNNDVPSEYVEEAQRLVRQYYGTDVRAWLVGSRVDGEPNNNSDLDIVVEKMPTRRKQGGRGGAGRYVADTNCGIAIDIIEDEDGPVRGEERTPVRIQ